MLFCREAELLKTFLCDLVYCAYHIGKGVKLVLGAMSMYRTLEVRDYKSEDSVPTTQIQTEDNCIKLSAAHNYKAVTKDLCSMGFFVGNRQKYVRSEIYPLGLTVLIKSYTISTRAL